MQRGYEGFDYPLSFEFLVQSTRREAYTNGGPEDVKEWVLKSLSIPSHLRHRAEYYAGFFMDLPRPATYYDCSTCDSAI